MTLSDVQGHASIAGLLKCDFLYNCSAVDNISTYTAYCTVLLRQLSFLLYIPSVLHCP